MSIIIKITLYSEKLENSGKYAWIAKISAMKGFQERKRQEISNISSLEEMLVSIKTFFSKKPDNSIIEIFDENLITYFEEAKYFTKVEKTESDKLKELPLFKDLLRYNSEENGGEVPAFVHYIPEDNFSKNILLFRIALFFDQNPGLVFEFPLFLKMKPSLDPDWEVEDLIAVALEKSESIFNLE